MEYGAPLRRIQPSALASIRRTQDFGFLPRFVDADSHHGIGGAAVQRPISFQYRRAVHIDPVATAGAGTGDVDTNRGEEEEEEKSERAGGKA